MSKTPFIVQGRGFTALVGVQTPSDPSTSVPPTKIRSTYRFQVGRMGRRAHHVLNHDASGPVTSTVTLVSNDFTTGRAFLLLGDLVVTSGVDFIPQVLLADTTDTLATAISRLPGFVATSDGVDTITITWSPGVGEWSFEAQYGGTVQNYSLSPLTGFLQQGSPRAGPPIVG